MLRLVPPVGVGQLKVALKDDMVLCNGSLRIPRGTMVWISHHAIQNCEQNWDDPTKFMPGAMLPCVESLRESATNGRAAVLV